MLFKIIEKLFSAYKVKKAYKTKHSKFLKIINKQFIVGILKIVKKM